MTDVPDRAALERALEDASRGTLFQGNSGCEILASIPAESLAILMAAARAHLATLPKTKMVWVVSESTTTLPRQYEHLQEALAAAGEWVSQSAGDVTISRREVPA